MKRSLRSLQVECRTDTGCYQAVSFSDRRVCRMYSGPRSACARRPSDVRLTGAVSSIFVSDDFRDEAVNMIDTYDPNVINGVVWRCDSYEQYWMDLCEDQCYQDPSCKSCVFLRNESNVGYGNACICSSNPYLRGPDIN